jgi:hypothetical protein
MTVRHLTRIAAAALLAAGVVTGAATPALAAEADFGLGLRSATDGVVTNVVVTISNNGTTRPEKIALTLDTSAIDKSRATIVAPQGCAASEVGFECVYPGGFGMPGPGESVTLNVVFWAPGDAAPGGVGELRATLTVEADVDKASVPVVMPALRSPVLRASPLPVTQVESDEYNGKPIPPGGKSVAYVDIYNHGSRSAVGVRTVARLPEGVRFVPDGLDNCDFSADKRTATCEWKGESDYTLIPLILDETLDGFAAGARVRLPIEVDKGVKGPVKLDGGEWSFAPIATEEPELDAHARETLQMKAPMQDKPAPEPRDHIEFPVVVGAAATGGDSAGGGGDSDEPSLPITGPGSAAVAGTGAACVALGVFLLFAVRRRKTLR